MLTYDDVEGVSAPLRLVQVSQRGSWHLAVQLICKYRVSQYIIPFAKKLQKGQSDDQKNPCEIVNIFT